MRIHITKDGYTPATVPGGDNQTVTLTARTLVEIDGSYAVTFMAADGCDRLPPELRRRTYTATVNRGPGYRAVLTAELSGASFFPEYGTLCGNISNDAVVFYVSSWDAFNRWLEEERILEKLPSGGYLSLIGTATATVERPDAFLATFEGAFAYCAAEAPAATPYPPSCSVALVDCKSPHHQIAWLRR